MRRYRNNIGKAVLIIQKGDVGEGKRVRQERPWRGKEKSITTMRTGWGYGKRYVNVVCERGGPWIRAEADERVMVK